MPSDFTTQTLNSLPVAYRVDSWLIDLLEAVKVEYDAQSDKLKDIYAQLFLDSATWRVAGEETEAGLPVRPAVPLEDRRAALSAKWRSGAKCDIELIRGICSAWANANPQVSYDGKRLVAVFCTVSGDITAIVRTLRDTIPAHLFMTFTAARAQETTGVYMGAAQIGKSSRSALPVLEPEQSLTDNLFLYTGARETASRSILPRLEADQSLTAALSINAGTNETISRSTLPPMEADQRLDAPITINMKPGGISSRAVLLNLNGGE